MKKIFTACLTVLSVFSLSAATPQTDGIVYKDKTKRFTVVSDGLVRMEYAPDGKFNDAPSFIGYNRSYPKTDAKVTDDGKNVTITTSKLTLNYKKCNSPFSADNLTIVSAEGVKPFEWKPGTPQKMNLEGTTRTLDWWNGDELQWETERGNGAHVRANLIRVYSPVTVGLLLTIHAASCWMMIR